MVERIPFSQGAAVDCEQGERAAVTDTPDKSGQQIGRVTDADRRHHVTATIGRR
jgi:hypothetical protein